jgi:hypothetical protein
MVQTWIFVLVIRDEHFFRLLLQEDFPHPGDGGVQVLTQFPVFELKKADITLL